MNAGTSAVQCTACYKAFLQKPALLYLLILKWNNVLCTSVKFSLKILLKCRVNADNPYNFKAKLLQK